MERIVGAKVRLVGSWLVAEREGNPQRNLSSDPRDSGFPILAGNRLVAAALE
jgi:hypothetical protein